jgi:hypothetical protein
MTRVFLAAGVAALAIAAPASAKPGGHDGNRVEKAERGGGQNAQRQQRAQRTERAAPQRQRAERPQRAERRVARPQRAERQQTRAARADRHQARPDRVERAKTRVADRHQARPQRTERVQTRAAERQQARPNRAEKQRVVERQRVQPNRVQQVDRRMADRQQLRFDRQSRQQDLKGQRQQIRGERQMATRNLLAERHALRADRIANEGIFRESRIARSLDLGTRTRFIAPARAVRFVGEPLRNVTNYVTLSALPASVSYLYPATSNYYYQYGGGYLYQVDRSSSLIAALIPLLAGGFLPGTYLPQTYMSSYVPSYYGLNSFYPASYAYGYGAGYGYGGNNYSNNICNRYAYGTVYQVDCMTGMVVNVIPTYAGGYGVGQMLPSSYSYYNLPMQYRDMYYPTADYSYWYAPGAIYQYDRGSSLITSVAALMSPGFSVGQPLPMGYNMYNVPMAYRATYYDTPNSWYRYNNGYIYQVDPTTQLVTAIVASLLT